MILNKIVLDRGGPNPQLRAHSTEQELNTMVYRGVRWNEVESLGFRVGVGLVPFALNRMEVLRSPPVFAPGRRGIIRWLPRISAPGLGW
jgi:hypothetical protein